MPLDGASSLMLLTQAIKIMLRGSGLGQSEVLGRRVQSMGRIKFSGVFGRILQVDFRPFLGPLVAHKLHVYKGLLAAEG